MSKLGHYTVCFLLWLVRALCCPDDCYCHSVVVDGEDGMDVDCEHTLLTDFSSIPRSAFILDLSNTMLQVIPPEIKSLTNLRELDLSSNRLGSDDDEGLPDDTFSTLVYLRVLDLSENSLSTLSSNTFNGLVRLEKLDLYRNEIVRLPLGMLQLLPNTAVVCLGRNFWDCGMCQFHETLEWYLSNDNVTDVCNREVPACYLPSDFRKRRFTEVSLEEIRKCDEEKVITTSSTFISTPTDLSTELSNVTVGSQHLSVSANTHTTTTSPEINLSTELSDVTVGSQHLSVSANTHTTTAHKTTTSPEMKLSTELSDVTVGSQHLSVSANTHTTTAHTTTTSPEMKLSTELSDVTVGSQHLSVSANTHTTTAYTTPNSPEFYSNSGKASFQMRKLGSWSWFLLIIAFLAPKMATGQTIRSSLLIMGLLT